MTVATTIIVSIFCWPRGSVLERPGWRTMLRGSSWDHHWSWRPSTWSVRSGWTTTCLGGMLGRDILVNIPVKPWLKPWLKWWKMKGETKTLKVVFSSPCFGLREHGLTDPKPKMVVESIQHEGLAKKGWTVNEMVSSRSWAQTCEALGHKNRVSAGWTWVKGKNQ